MTHAPDISALIVNYNSGPLLTTVVEKLHASTAGLDVETIVWDNASADGSTERLEAAVPGITVVRSAGNIGFVRATNAQLKMARGRTVLLLNSDAVPDGDAIRVMFEYLQSHPEVGAVGPRLQLPDGRLDAACRRHFKTFETYVFKVLGLDRVFASHPRFGRYNLTYLDPSVLTPVDALSGACMLVRREALDSIGWQMDERFRMYCEDEDWCCRLAAAGWTIVYLPSALVWHYKGSSSAPTWRVRMRTTFEWHRSVALFHAKHLASRYAAPTNAVVYASIAALGALTMVRRSAARRRPRRHVQPT